MSFWIRCRVQLRAFKNNYFYFIGWSIFTLVTVVADFYFVQSFIFITVLCLQCSSNVANIPLICWLFFNGDSVNILSFQKKRLLNHSVSNHNSQDKAHLYTIVYQIVISGLLLFDKRYVHNYKYAASKLTKILSARLFITHRN